MKKIILLGLLLAGLSFTSNAQMRKLRKDEIDFYNNLHAVLYNSLPHQFKDWKVVEDGKDFDVFKYFCPIVYANDDCTGKVDASLGKKDPYSLNYTVDFSMQGNQADSVKGAMMSLIKDYNDATQIATALKSTAKTTLHINVNTNIDVPNSGIFTLVYCPKTPYETLQLPVPFTLAVLGRRSASCPYTTDGRPNMSPGGDGYYDDAAVFLGKPVNFTNKVSRGDSMSHIEYGIAFNKAKIGIPVIQNIVVTFKGDAEDIKAAVQLIDWQKLYALIDK